MTFSNIAQEEWKKVKLFFTENNLATQYHLKEDHENVNKRRFVKLKKGGVFSVYENFFMDFNKDGMALYVAEGNVNYVTASIDYPELRKSFEWSMKKANITIEEVNIDGRVFMKLDFPENFNTEQQLEQVKKNIKSKYTRLLYKKLLVELLFSTDCEETDRPNIYRGLMSVYAPVTLLKKIASLMNESLLSKNPIHAVSVLENILIKLILIDRDKNTLKLLKDYIKKPVASEQKGKVFSEEVAAYRKILEKLYGLNNINKSRLTQFKEQLELATDQSNGCIKKKKEILINITKKEEDTVDLETITRDYLAQEFGASFIDGYAKEFARALMKKSYYNYLNLLPENFHQQAWTKITEQSTGKPVQKVITDFNQLSYRTVMDIIYSVSLHHQNNVVIFYIKTINELIEMGDFNSAQAIFSGLNHLAVSRLSYLQPIPCVKKSREEIERIFMFSDAKRNYKEEVKKAIFSGKIVIPCLDLHLSELTHAEDGNATLNPDFTLNIEKIILLGGMHANLDASRAYLYLAQILPSRVSLKKIEQVNLDEDKIYEASLHHSPRDRPDLNNCESIKDLFEQVYVKRSLPLYLNILYRKERFTAPKAYSKLMDCLEAKLEKKEVSLEDLEDSKIFVNKLRLHAKRNFMLPEGCDIEKKMDKLNSVCIDKINEITLPDSFKSKLKIKI